MISDSCNEICLEFANQPDKNVTFDRARTEQWESVLSIPICLWENKLSISKSAIIFVPTSSFLLLLPENEHSPYFLWFPLMRIIILNGQLFYTKGLFFEFPKVSAQERVECSSYPNLRSSASVRDWHSYV